ncbi:MAG: CaiB/BaiF CoA transferase family protein [Flavobacteriales bacterium]
MENLFEGYTVIELSSVLAGPYAGMMFSELGAKVIKVENQTTGGDVTRGWKSKGESAKTSISSYYASVNYRKEVLMLDFTKMNDINKVYELLKTADVVITNFKFGDDFRFALDYGRVKTVNPKIIYAKLLGFNSEPTKVAYDVVVQAECGYMYMNGSPEGPPTKIPVALMDVLAGHQLRSGILAALLRRTKTGKGALVEVSLESSAIASLVNQGTNYLMNGNLPERLGSRHPNIALYGEIVTSSDQKELVLALGSQKHFEKLCRLLQLEELIQKYDSNLVRLEHLDALSELIRSKFKTGSLVHWREQLNVHDIPFGEIKNMEDVSRGSTGTEMIKKENREGETTLRFSTIGFSVS